MLASNLVLKARYRSHIRLSLPSFLPLNIASEFGVVLRLFVCLKTEIAESKLLAIFLCKKQSCKQFYGTENFKYVSTFFPCQYKHSTYKSGFKYLCIFLSFPVWLESAALYLVKRIHWKKTFCNLYNIHQIFKDSSIHFRTVFWNRARNYSSSKDQVIFGKLSTVCLSSTQTRHEALQQAKQLHLQRRLCGCILDPRETTEPARQFHDNTMYKGFHIFILFTLTCRRRTSESKTPLSLWQATHLVHTLTKTLK